MRVALGVFLAAVLLLAAIGCGRSSTSHSGSTPDPGPSDPGSHKGVSREFLSPGGENKYATFGQEASEEEREAASSVLEENLRARQDRDWETQCSSLIQPVKEEIAPKPGLQTLMKACAKGLGELAHPLSSSSAARKDTLRGEIGVLRVQGNRAYALFHGTEGKDYAMPMEKEGSEWKVAALVMVEIN